MSVCRGEWVPALLHCLGILRESGGGWIFFIKGGGVLLGNGGSVSLEESVAEWLCTAAGSGLLVPPLLLHHHYYFHHHHRPLSPAPHPRLLPCTALRLPSLGNCLRALPACSVIGRWHGGVPLPDPASCTASSCFTTYPLPTPCLSYTYTHTQIHPTPLDPIARQRIQAFLPPRNFIGQSRMAQTCSSGMEGDKTNFWI